jgi:hypothetical protein
MACVRLVQRQHELLFERQGMHREELGGRRASAPRRSEVGRNVRRTRARSGPGLACPATHVNHG